MKILFVMRHPGYNRNFEAVLRSLADHGHQVHIAFERGWPHDFPEVALQLATERKEISFGGISERLDIWRELANGVRYSIDYLRYLAPVYKDTPKIRARGEKYTPGWIVKLTKLPGFRSRFFVAFLMRVVRAIDRAIPTDPDVDEFVRDHDPDLVLTTPLVAGPSQAEYVRSAQKLGRHTALPVHSWDNLSNKGLLRERPERIYVWNETQLQEARELHGASGETVVVTGAYPYDHWFRWTPSTTREEYCAKAGIDPSRPFVLYLCSSGFICPDERPVVESWLQQLRAHSDETVRSLGAVVRPHPLSGQLWVDGPVDAFDNAAVWPRHGTDPRNTPNRNDFYDSLYHSAAVLGVNTSAMIEAAIVGRRTFGFRLPELFGGQEGTIHFHYLLAENGGPLTLADSLEEHFDQLAQALREGDPPDWNRSFLAAFVRPRGLDVEATPLFVRDLEELMASPRPVSRRRPLRAVFSALLYPLAWIVHHADSGKHRAKISRRRFEAPALVRSGDEFDPVLAREQWEQARRQWSQTRDRWEKADEKRTEFIDARERLRAIRVERKQAKEQYVETGLPARNPEEEPVAAEEPAPPEPQDTKTKLPKPPKPPKQPKQPKKPKGSEQSAGRQ